jgi:hypothetical protein
MKKTVLSGFILASLILMTVLVGCKKEEATNAPSSIGVATLTGNIKAELDNTIDGMENCPGGTKIIAIINSSDLVPDGGGDIVYENIIYETTVDGSGNYTFNNIAAGNKEVTVKLYPADFIYYQKQWDNTTVRKVYSASEGLEMNVIKGQTKVLDFNYND